MLQLFGRDLFLLAMMFLVISTSMAQDRANTSAFPSKNEPQRQLENFRDSQHEHGFEQMLPEDPEEVGGGRNETRGNRTRGEYTSTHRPVSLSAFVLVAVIVVCVLIIALVAYFVLYAAEQDANTRNWRKRQPDKAKEFKEVAESEVHLDGSDDRDRERPPPPPRPPSPKRDSSEQVHHKEEAVAEDAGGEDEDASRQAIKQSSAKRHPLQRLSPAIKKLLSAKLKHGKVSTRPSSATAKKAKTSKMAVTAKNFKKFAGKKKSSKGVLSKKPVTKSKSRKK